MNLYATSNGVFQATQDKVGATIWYSHTLEENDVISSLDNWVNQHVLQSKPKSEDHEEDSNSDYFSDIDVQLIIVDSFATGEAKTLATQWGIEHGAEIIDFSEDDSDSDENTEDVHIFAANGQKRVVEALQTVMWPELCEAKSSTTDDVDSAAGESDDFETLFANMVAFKETAAGLPDEERRKFAEKVALSFYSALGGSSDEEA